MKEPRSILIGSVVALLTLVACGGTTQERFEPAERATATSPEGYTAAEYVMSTRSGAIGDARVWSRGARVMNVNGARRTVIHVGFALENHSNRPIELDLEQLRLDSATLDRMILRDIQPARVDGPLTLQPGEARDIEAYFPMPRGVSPRDVDAFRVKWRISDREVTYQQQTPFLRSADEATAYVYYYTPFYDPFFYDPYLYHPRRIIVYARPYRHYHVRR